MIFPAGLMLTQVGYANCLQHPGDTVIYLAQWLADGAAIRKVTPARTSLAGGDKKGSVDRADHLKGRNVLWRPGPAGHVPGPQ